MPYRILFKPSADKQFDKLSHHVRQRIAPKIDALSENPRPNASAPLSGYDDLRRMRVGNYRVIYALSEEEKTIRILKIAHRSHVYRRL